MVKKVKRPSVGRRALREYTDDQLAWGVCASFMQPHSTARAIVVEGTAFHSNDVRRILAAEETAAKKRHDKGLRQEPSKYANLSTRLSAFFNGQEMSTRAYSRLANDEACHEWDGVMQLHEYAVKLIKDWRTNPCFEGMTLGSLHRHNLAQVGTIHGWDWSTTVRAFDDLVRGAIGIATPRVRVMRAARAAAQSRLGR